MKHETLLAVDTASLYFRAFYGLPTTLRTPDGRPANAVRGLADFLARFIMSTGPTHLVCAWDDDWRPGWRVALVPSYKTHRLADSDGATDAPVEVNPHVQRVTRHLLTAEDGEEAPDELHEQVPMIVEMLEAAGIVTVGAPHCEADDVLGSLSRQVPFSVRVLTGDRDLLQLVDDERDVRVLYTAAGISKTVELDEAAVVAAHGVLPRQYVDYAVLRGDPSDGLPGVAGIGPKTAQSLLARFDDLDHVMAAVGDPSSGLAAGVRAKLSGARDYVARARRVVATVDDLVLDMDLDEFRLTPVADTDRWAETSARLGLGSAGERLQAALAAMAR